MATLAQGVAVQRSLAQRLRAPKYAGYLLVLPAIPVDAYASPDRVFRSGFEPALVIEGRAGWAVPLAGASVELRFGNQVNTTTTAADGSFEVGVELDELDGGDILELTARGTGAQAHLAWASPLGPAGRLLELAGASHRLDFAREPYVHLNPRTTVDAAMMRAFHGGQPIMDAKAYYHAALKRHSWSNRLVFAAAMVELEMCAAEAGELVFPHPTVSEALREAILELRQ